MATEQSVESLIAGGGSPEIESTRKEKTTKVSKEQRNKNDKTLHFTENVQKLMQMGLFTTAAQYTADGQDPNQDHPGEDEQEEDDQSRMDLTPPPTPSICLAN